MAPSTAHLLGLPRELRDMIYSHLSRDIVLEWEWKADTKFQGRIKRVDIRLHDAPIAHVLRIHPQVYAEYKEAACFSKLSATVTVDLLAPVQDMCTIRVGSLTHVRNALAHVRYATMSFDYMAHPESKRGPRHQETLDDMIDDFTYMAPNLSVFRYAIHQRVLTHRPGTSLRSALTHRDFLHGDVPYLAATRDNFLSNPPASLGELPLLQSGEGYKLYYHGQLDKDAALRCLYWVHHVLPDRNVVPFHQIAKIGVYMFGVGLVDNHFWTKNEIADLWGLPNDYPSPDILQPSSKDEYEMIACLPHEMQQWKEKRGAELVCEYADTMEQGRDRGTMGDEWMSG